MNLLIWGEMSRRKVIAVKLFNYSWLFVSLFSLGWLFGFIFFYFLTKHDDLSLLIVCLFFSFFFLFFFFFFFWRFSYIFLTWHEWWLLFFIFWLVGWLFSFLFFIWFFFFFKKSIWENFYKLLFPFSYFSPQPKKKKTPSTFSFTQPNMHTRKLFFFPSSYHFSPLNQIEN